MGASLAVQFDDDLSLHQFGTGTCAGSPVDSATRVRIGSTTKPLTAATLVVALDRAGLDLGEKVATVLADEAPDRGGSLTFRDLLRHQDGLDGVYWDGFGDDEHAIVRYTLACDDLGRIFPPGQSWAYSNSAYVLAGRAIERLTGRRYETAVDDLVLAPAGCVTTSVLELSPPDDGANGHYVTGDGLRCAEPPTGQRALAPAGAAAWGTPRDLLGWASHLLAPDAFARLRNEAVPLPPSDQDAATHQSLGWKLFDWGDPICVGHDGGSEGQATFLRFCPERNSGIALTANTTPSAMFLWAELAEWFYEQVDIHPPGRRSAAPDASADPSDLGVYETRDARFIFSTGGDGLQLSVRTFGSDQGPVAEAEPLGDRVFRTVFPIFDAYGVFSIEPLANGERLLHAGPFTARRSTA